MPRVVGVRFHGVGKAYDFDPGNLEVNAGDAVIVETSKGIEYGIASFSPYEKEADQLFGELRPILRLADEKDLEIYRANVKKETDAFYICRERIANHNLDMNLVDVEYTFDGQKIIFYFISENRVDFRELVKDLATTFHRRIELRQIGARDEARMVGGVGICGRTFCCSTFLDDFVPVSVKMAKFQNLSMNPTKISGCCGRLMCCLKYEQEAYEDARKIAPKQGSTVQSPAGEGRVISVDLLRERAGVLVYGANGEELQHFPFGELQFQRGHAESLNNKRKKSNLRGDNAAAKTANCANCPAKKKSPASGQTADTARSGRVAPTLGLQIDESYVREAVAYETEDGQVAVEMFAASSKRELRLQRGAADSASFGTAAAGDAAVTDAEGAAKPPRQRSRGRRGGGRNRKPKAKQDEQ